MTHCGSSCPGSCQLWDQICRQLDQEGEEQDEFLDDVEAEIGTKEFRELMEMGEKLYDKRLKICI